MKGRGRDLDPRLCDKCHKFGPVTYFRKQYLCGKCMIGPENPAELEDFMYRSSPLSDLGGMDGAAPRGMGQRSNLLRDLKKGMKKMGLLKSKEQYKDSMFAGAKKEKKDG